MTAVRHRATNAKKQTLRLRRFVSCIAATTWLAAVPNDSWRFCAKGVLSTASRAPRSLWRLVRPAIFSTDVCIRISERGAGISRLSGTIEKAIDAFDPDVLHAWLPPVLTIPAMWAAQRKKLPVITSYRSAERLHDWLSIAEYVHALALADGIVSNHAR